jgi:hypothetical protein
MSSPSGTYVVEMCPEIRVNSCDMNLRTGILSRSYHIREIRAYSYLFTVRKFALFPTYLVIIVVTSLSISWRMAGSWCSESVLHLAASPTAWQDPDVSTVSHQAGRSSATEGRCACSL